MRWLRVIVASALLTLPIAALSRAPAYSVPGAGDALLRFSWRMSASAREQCRPRTQQELDALPVHMRTPDICTTDRADYLLITRIGDAAPDTTPLLRGGVKGDRPLFVLEEIRMARGEARVLVEVQRSVPGSDVELIARLDTALTFVEGGVRLVTMNGGGRLIVR
jgi:hypothetical protein